VDKDEQAKGFSRILLKDIQSLSALAKAIRIIS
jgi:hypothetical protein